VSVLFKTQKKQELLIPYYRPFYTILAQVSKILKLSILGGPVPYKPSPSTREEKQKPRDGEYAVRCR
jgi:hypothetical protein